MKTKLVILGIVVLLSGCVVAPAYRVQPAVVVQSEVVYPQYETAYVWDPVAMSFFFMYSSHRYYMDRGWHPHYGYPRGYYRHR